MNFSYTRAFFLVVIASGIGALGAAGMLKVVKASNKVHTTIIDLDTTPVATSYKGLKYRTNANPE